MKRFIGAAILAVLFGLAANPIARVMADDTSDPATEGTKPPLPEKSAITGNSPDEIVKAAAKGTLRNPYTDDPEKIQEGRKLFLSYSCNGCHGGNGGGGMCPPLSNETWVYGSDDDTLFRLVALGSDQLQAAGYYRIGMENVIGPMPPFGELVKSDDELWKIIAFVRSIYNGDPKRRNW
ncbi:MAG TPA: c-type cytochrome [Bradyrhizobium sp.]|nr:c-type cytochrome [Bradyrhizobium sp.]